MELRPTTPIGKMTAQINDRFRYCDSEYSLVGLGEGEVFDIFLLGLKPAMAGTACRRGYQAVFAVVEARLVLDALHVNVIPSGMSAEPYRQEEAPVINGVAPSPATKDFERFNNHYKGLNYSLEYSGGLLLGSGFIENLYVHMGFHPAWKYERVIELIFDAGILKQEFDRSERMAEIREIQSREYGLPSAANQR